MKQLAKTSARYVAAFSLLFALLGTQKVMAESYTFGVLPQRNAVLTAQFWNPILEYVSAKAGVSLSMKTTRTGQESSQAISRGEYDFTYSNHIFKAPNNEVGYQVILRPRSAQVYAQIVVTKSSPIRHLADLKDKPVGFPSRAAFLAYAVAMDELLRKDVTVVPTFGGNQEGIMGQLKAGRVMAAAVNSEVMQDFSKRENFQYRIIWQSQPFYNLPIAAHPRVPRQTVEAVRKAFAGMSGDPEGLRVLNASNALIQQAPPYGYIAAGQKEYQAYIDFYRQTIVKDME